MRIYEQRQNIEQLIGHAGETGEIHQSRSLSLARIRDRVQPSLDAEADRRAGERSRPSPPSFTPCPSPAMAVQIVDRGWRVLASRYHPDHGGAHEQMIALNAAAAWLRALVREMAAGDRRG
jgi:hypothetical protein